MWCELRRTSLLLLVALPALAAEPLSEHTVAPLEEMRYCGPPRRDAHGHIVRSAAVLAAFRRAHPCPVTGLLSGSCPGWELDHVIPLVCGGCDSVSNLQWLPQALKSAAVTGKDRFERLIYCQPMQVVK